VWQVLESSFAALSDVHAEHVVHRALTPDSVHILTDGAVMFSDFAVARIQGEQSIASVAANLDYEHAFLSPECRIDLRLASPASDVYSLAFSLLSWITGAESDDPEELFLSLGDTTSLDDWAIDNLSEVFADCFLQQPDERPSASQLLELIRGNRALVGRSESPTQGMLLQPGAVIDDQYEVIRLLGQGGTGRSYLAKDFRADMFCVLKTIENPELVTELARTEFGILVNLHHENIQRVFDVRAPDSLFHLKLEYVEGSALRDVAELHRGDVAFGRRVGRQVLQALSYMSERDLVHRDISPGNIIIPDNPTQPVKLIDFSLAAKAHEGRGLVGTPRYRAPEVDAGLAAGHAADLYSLGTVLFELLTGRLPYEVAEDGIPLKHSPATLSPEEDAHLGVLREPLLKATAPEPSRRYETAAEFSEALGIELLPYVNWVPRELPDPEAAEMEALIPGLVEIVQAEGPMECHRAYRLYAESQGRQWRTYASPFNKAMFAAVRVGLVEQRDECGIPGQRHRTVRVPGSPPVVMRERGNRRADEIPWSEMADLMRFIISEEDLDATDTDDQDLLYYELEDYYGFDSEDYSVPEKMEAVMNRYILNAQGA
jgi:serine/threonine protein kinase